MAEEPTEFAAVIRHGLGEALAHKHIGAKAGRKRIVATVILGGLFSPKVVTKHCIEVKAALQRLKAPISNFQSFFIYIDHGI